MRNLYLRLLFVIVSSYMTCGFTIAQSRGKMKELRVYYLDLTASMDNPKYGGTLQFWMDVKNNLKNAIDAIETPSTEIVVATFTSKSSRRNDNEHGINVLGGRAFHATSKDKIELKKLIDSLTTKVHSTHIDQTFDDFYNKYLTEEYENYIIYQFVMTDGVQSGDVQKLIRQIELWNGKTKDKYIYGFYVLLKRTDSAKIENIKKNEIVIKAIDGQKHLWYIETADVNINLVQFDNVIEYKVRGGVNSCKVPISYLNNKHKSNGLNLAVTLKTRSENYKLMNSQLEGDSVLVVVIDTLKNVSCLPPYDTLNVAVRLTNADNSFDKTRTFLSDTLIQIVCVNELKPAIQNIFVEDLHSNYLGASTFRKKALIWDADTTGIERIFNFNFDNDAKSKGEICYAVFQFVNDSGNPIPSSELEILLKSHEKYSCISTFKVTPKDAQKTFRFRYLPSAKEGKHHIKLKLVEYANLKCVKNIPLAAEPTPVVADYTIRFDKKINPFWWWLMGILALCILCYAIYRFALLWCYLIAPKFPLNCNIMFKPQKNNPGAKNLEICTMDMYYNGVLLANRTGNELYTHDHFKAFIKAIILEHRNNNYYIDKDKWHGDTIYLYCDFFNDYIKQIVISPVKNHSYRDVKATIIFTDKSVQVIEGIKCNELFYKDLYTQEYPILNSSIAIQGYIPETKIN